MMQLKLKTAPQGGLPLSHGDPVWIIFRMYQNFGTICDRTKRHEPKEKVIILRMGS